MSKPVFGYWDIRGKGEAIRSLLAFVGESYEDKRIKCTEYPVAHRNHRSEWKDELKPNLGLDFPNIPYYIDGELKLTESVAILRYLGRKYGLTVNQDPDLVKLEIFESFFTDYKTVFVRFGYSPNYKEEIGDYKEKAHGKLPYVNNYLKGKQFIAGEKLTYLDFYVFECFDVQRHLIHDLFDNYENIKAYLTRMENLEKLKNYRESDRFKEYPINYTFAKWGFKKDDHLD